MLKNVSEPSNPPDELAHNVSEKNLSDEVFLHFSSKVQNLTVFSIIYMIRIRFFGLVRINSEWVFRCTVIACAIDDSRDYLQHDTLTEPHTFPYAFTLYSF